MFDLTPFDRMSLFSPQKEIDDFEKRFFGRALPVMRTDIRETEKAYLLEAELAGFGRDDIRVTVKDHLLTITAERDGAEEDGKEGGGYLRRERTRGCISRSFDVSGIATVGITAAFRDGILTVTLPKPEHPRDTERDVKIN